jgi:hypothetical protein
MKEWGWTNPVLADEAGGLISGHGRVLAARQLGITEVPVMIARGWTEAQKRAYVIADNKLALNAGWDDELLRLELGELKLSGFDLGLTGFGDIELETALGEPIDNPSWSEMPEFHQEDLMNEDKIVVHFSDETARREFSRLIGRSITSDTRYIWFPDKP